jgi:hypothetical protein
MYVLEGMIYAQASRTLHHNAMPNAISESTYKPVSSLYATLSYSSSSQRGRRFNSSGSLEGSLIRKSDFDRIHPFHILRPACK